MSQENVELLRRLLAAFTRRDKAAWLALCDPEIEWVPPANWPESGVTRGCDAVWDFILKLDEPWTEGAYELTEAIDAGSGTVAARLRRHVQGGTSGVEAEFDFWNVATFRDRRLVRSEWFAGRAQALEAAGLSE